MARLSKKIFREVDRPTDKKSMKVFRIFSDQPAHLNPFIVNYYPRLIEIKQLMDGVRAHGLYTDEYQDFKDEMKKRREARGKVKKIPHHILKRLEAEAAEKNKSD